MKKFRSESLINPYPKGTLPFVKGHKKGLSLLKGLTLFFLGASIAVLATYALNIDPAIDNAVQYIQKIVLTSDGTAGGTTGIVLDGDGSLQVIGNFVAGASDNQANGTGSFVGGGGNNQANGEKAAVVGGSGNQASGSASFVGGGALNYASGSASFVGGGVDNKANGDASFIGGGRLNQANGNFSFAAGVKAVANANNTFVWNSDTSYFTGSVTGSFVVNAPGGVGIGTNDPLGYALNVVGTGKFSQGVLSQRYCDTAGSNCVLPSEILTGTSITSRFINENAGVATNEVPKKLNANNFTGSNIYSSGGNVGIGTSSPQAALEVHGDVKMMAGPTNLAEVDITSVTTLTTLVAGSSSDKLIAVRLLFSNTDTGDYIRFKIGFDIFARFSDEGSALPQRHHFALIPLPAGKELKYETSSMGFQGGGTLYIDFWEFPLGL